MPNLPVSIRGFREEDFESLYTIDQICFPAHIAFSRAELGFYLHHPKSITRVAEGLGGILGFVLARVEHLSCAHVITLDVVPEVRQRRIGTTLMNALHGVLKKRQIGTATLEVGVRNIAAQRLYEKLQYRYLERLPGYYRGWEDAYRMARPVKTPGNASGCKLQTAD